MTLQLELVRVEDTQLCVRWQAQEAGDCVYKLFWSDRFSRTMEYKCVYEGKDTVFTLKKATHIPHYLRAEAWKDGVKLAESGDLPKHQEFSRHTLT